MRKEKKRKVLELDKIYSNYHKSLDGIISLVRSFLYFDLKGTYAFL